MPPSQQAATGTAAAGCRSQRTLRVFALEASGENALHEVARDASESEVEALEAEGEPLIAIDELGSRLGDRVMVALDGSAIKELLGVNNSPARCIVLGQVDEERGQTSEVRGQ